MEKDIEYGLKLLREYLSRGLNPNECLQQAASEAANKFGTKYSVVKSTLAALQFGIF